MLCFCIQINILILGGLLPVISNSRIIKTRQGVIEGTTHKARNGNLFNAFYGIRYGKSPVGDLRFQPPVRAGSWKGIFNATTPSNMCPQYPEGTKIFTGDEDCLYVDVFTPDNAKPGDNIPVLVYIFGGIFKFGSTTREGPQYYMSERIILIMVSFRLGALGFFTTGDAIISGNMALKDQTMALRWTNDNIEDFGGDPTRITLGGHSSGGACVHMHTLSPLSQGLFSRAIMQSGLVVSPQSIYSRETSKYLSMNVAKKLNCPMLSSKIILDCMRSKPVEDIIDAADKITLWHSLPETLFRPTIEDEKANDAFLTRHPLDAQYPSENVSWLIGMTSGEGAYYVNEYFHDFKDFDMKSQLLFPILGLYKWTSKINHLNYLSQLLHTHFFGDQVVGKETDLELTDMLTGAMHGMGLIEVLEKYNGLKYVYLYDYKANYSGQITVGTYGKYLGVAHADEMCLFFQSSKSVTVLSPTDIEFSQELIRKWINFMYSGNPNSPYKSNKFTTRWEPMMKSSRITYLRLKINGTMESNYFTNKFRFWKKIPFNSNLSNL